MISLPSELWKPLRPHPEQAKLWRCRKRFIVIVAGRRSGKTEIGAKRPGVVEALEYQGPSRAKFVFAAPTREQAKKIYWEDLKARIPKPAIADVRETELEIELVTTTRVCVVGMDKAERVEGEPLDWICLDELDAMKAGVWEKTVRPALSTPGRPPGRARFVGKPKGRRTLFNLFRYATESGDPEWAGFHWKSSSVIDPDEDASARRTLDPRSYSQEYDADFINLEGRIYYPFERPLHAAERLPYFADEPLALGLDFNVSPGILEVLQEQRYWGTNPRVAGEITASIDEVWIRDDSNTRLVCRAFLNKLARSGQPYRNHRGLVLIYGDATGGAGGTAKVQGSDWEIVRQELGPVFGSRLRFHVPDANPPERVRVNAVNARLMSADGRVRWLVDPERCPKLIDDFESVQGNKDGSGDIDKDPQRFGMLTHTCFAPGTLVSTPDGPTAIENIRTGDLVDTPIGPMPAVQAPRGRAPESMLTITAEDGTSFSCTLGHRLLTSRGWLEACNIVPDRDRLIAWRRSNESRSSPHACRYFSASSTECTAARGTSPTARIDCTESCGRTTTARFRSGVTSTTGTGTEETTRQRIWSALKLGPISAGTWPLRNERPSVLGPLSVSLERRPLRGMRPMSVENGIGSTTTLAPEQRCRRSPCLNRARSAGSTLRPIAQRDLGTARTHANPRRGAAAGSTTLRQGVLAVGRRSCGTSTSSASTARARALRVTTTSAAPASEPVCIAVPEVGCFLLASGLVVSNSDGAGYYVVKRHPLVSHDIMSSEL